MLSGPLWAAGGEVDDPVGIAPERYVYYPGTEPLGADEIRIIACGTGMPDARRLQASACFLVELGNGDKFVFDLGTGSMRNINSLMIPFEYLTKIFLTHLHTDHWSDLIAMWAGGWTAGRPGPLEVWGPSGTREDMGTKYAVEHMLKAFNWDKMTRSVQITPTAGEIIVHEFDYRGENQVVYEENGVVIRSIPAESQNSSRPSIAQPGANSATTAGAANTPMAVSASRMPARVPATWSTRSFSARRSPLARTSDRTGTKASEKEPSANSRRMKLGILKARKNASVAPLAPK